MPTRGRPSGSRRKGLSGSPSAGKGERGKQGPVHRDLAVLLGRQTNHDDFNPNTRELIDPTVRTGESRWEYPRATREMAATHLRLDVLPAPASSSRSRMIPRPSDYILDLLLFISILAPGMAGRLVWSISDRSTVIGPIKADLNARPPTF